MMLLAFIFEQPSYENIKVSPGHPSPERPLKIDKTKVLMTNGSLMKVECIATFDLHKAIIGLENQFSVFFRVAVLHRFYCDFIPHLLV